jgi:hypothetical protein
MSSALASLDKTLSGQLKDSVVRNVIRVLLVVYIVMITSIHRSTLEVFNNTFFQVAYLALLAYMALLDPASALLMAAAYLFTVQQLNRPEIKVVVSSRPMMMNSTPRQMKENFDEVTPVVANNQTMAPVISIASETHSEHPAYQTMTENLAKQGVFTSDLQFKDAQSNFVPEVDQSAGIKSWANQFSAQGVDLPRGFDPEIYRGTEL